MARGGRLARLRRPARGGACAPQRGRASLLPRRLEAEFEFDAKEGLPSKVVYKRQNAEGETVEEEDRYAQFIAIGAVRAPFVIDHYRAGQQSSRVNYDKVEFNQPLPDSLFAKPADIKSIKF